ncbi:MetQ/NlpA family ABC transporter substrate-binding protein [Streptomyces meridianus]|uniref:Lipoprotein n=1 Tax=Streptomyces meridianus TaxID=2938945 RepID=A0ABT0X4C9_9ACTN|nr:MetQ/NlpA family ABC transporter substrate-binding protein [Streptomyces meridianus]MCM2577100.1 MetQ/NlpA family ABC transporter substrate-binding protein [Streptomyces meridianus]
MRSRTRITLATALAAAVGLGSAACSAPSDSDTSAKGDRNAPLVVGANPTPHGDILNFVKQELAPKKGLKLEVKEFADYTQLNPATESGDVDANYFQHKPFLDDFNQQKGTHIVPVANVHVEPLALYSKKVGKLSELKPGNTIALPNDATNEGRALNLLAGKGLIALKKGVGAEATLGDVTDKKGLKFTELEAPQIPARLADVDAAVINGNFAIGAKLTPSKDALAIEEAKDNPYANFLAVKKGNEDDPRVRKLAELLQSDQVKKFIEKKYSDGSVIPEFGPLAS